MILPDGNNPGPPDVKSPWGHLHCGAATTTIEAEYPGLRLPPPAFVVWLGFVGGLVCE